MKRYLAILLCLLSTSAQAVTMSQRDCSWDNPGADPYRGNVSDAVDYFIEIPKDIRTTLKTRITAHQPDEEVAITKYAVRSYTGAFYSPVISDMHFGPNLVCNSVTRHRWPENMVQPAEIYCEGRYCIIVPRICGNISRIERADKLYELPKEPHNVPPEYGYGVPGKPHGEIPEPGSVLLLLAGVSGIMVVRKKR